MALAVEIKKYKPSTTSKLKDFIKLSYLTCNSGYRYDQGYYVEVVRQKCLVKIFVNGDQISNKDFDWEYDANTKSWSRLIV